MGRGITGFPFLSSSGNWLDVWEKRTPATRRTRAAAISRKRLLFTENSLCLVRKSSVRDNRYRQLGALPLMKAWQHRRRHQCQEVRCIPDNEAGRHDHLVGVGFAWSSFQNGLERRLQRQ